MSRNNGTKHVFYVMLAIFTLTLAVLLISVINTDFAEFYCNSISSAVRQVLSCITGFVSVSIAELLIYTLPVIIIACIVRSVRRKTFILSHFLCRLFSVILLLAVLFINTFGVCYFRKPLEQNLGLKRRELEREEVYNSSVYLKSELEKTVYKVLFDDKGASVNPYSWNETDNLIDKGYDRLCSEYSFITSVYSKPKQILISPLMTYTHISGMYMPFTGEANVNTNYPDYVVAFTIAHEKAHQRGIAGEDDANFIAFLALLASEDDYLRYSALMTMYDYFLDSLYVKDTEMYYYLIENTDKGVLGEMYAYSEFFDKYRNSGVSKVADSVNDTYLKSMGEEKGIDSYGLVIELFVAYIEKNNGLPY